MKICGPWSSQVDLIYLNLVGDIVCDMKMFVESKKKPRLSQEKGIYNTTVSQLEHVQEMDKLCKMYLEEQDAKEVLFYSLHEKENSYVLSAYLLTWKNSLFLEKTDIDGMMDVEEKIRFQTL